MYYDTSHVKESNEKLKLTSPSSGKIGTNAVAIEPGTTRVTLYPYPVSGYTHFVEKKTSAKAMSIWNTTMYIAGKTVGTVGGFILDGALYTLDKVDQGGGAQVHTFQSYRYFEKNGQVYKTSKSWGTFYQAEKEERFKHTFNSWKSAKVNETHTKSVDYVTSQSSVLGTTKTNPFKVSVSVNYNSDSTLAKRAWTNWYKGYEYYSSPEYY
ncbi:hypothetical protein [Gottfriedia acidiceleris]|uniref:hypothetical protein n=1 Tax=Gottfriedia acidiceleris TaxID=371036 RepID=UPI002FFE5625